MRNTASFPPIEVKCGAAKSVLILSAGHDDPVTMVWYSGKLVWSK